MPKRVVLAIFGAVAVLALSVLPAALAWARHDPANTAWQPLIVVTTMSAVIGLACLWAVFESLNSDPPRRINLIRFALSGTILGVFAAALATGFAGGVYPGQVYTHRDEVREIGRDFCRLQPVDDDQKRQCYEDLAGENIYFDLKPRPLKRFWHPEERVRVRAMLAKRADDEAKALQAQAAEEARRQEIEYQASLRPDIWRDPETGCEYLVQRGDGTQTYLERKDAKGRQICRKSASGSPSKQTPAA